jgi:4-hydroxy-3-polyprenylbenzoate decarboxylase
LRASNIWAAGACEYDFAGAIKDAPIEICSGPVTGLPIPAHAEIILEGHLLPLY